MSAEPRETERVEWDFEFPPCRRCGNDVPLYFNGGELDVRECCGLLYQLETPRIDLVITDLWPSGSPDT